MDLQKAIAFAKAAVGSPYVYGGTGRICTPVYRIGRTHQYPSQRENIEKSCPAFTKRTYTCADCVWKGKPCYDCAQLVRYAMQAGGSALPSGASSQWRYETAWSLKASLNPDYARNNFCALFRRDPLGGRYKPMAHVGIALGDGYVVDARSSDRGVVMEKLEKYPWTDMAVPSGISVNMRADAQIVPGSLPYGSRGDDVRELQTWLTTLNFPLPRYGIDGVYGQETAAAVKAFQHNNALQATGTADERTMAKLYLAYRDVRYLGMRGA